jgi:uncharacterized membrane protein (DUF2068 family)
VFRDVGRVTDAPQHYNPNPRAHPGLRAIALVELIKGLLALAAASGLALMGPASLRRWVEALIHRFQLDPDQGAMAWLAQGINPGSVHLAASAVLVYGAIHLVEAWGLWRDKAWASWLGCLTAALYLPFDGYALLHHRNWPSLVVFAINLLVVWVLARDLAKRRR